MSDRCNEPCPVHRCPSRCLLISGHASLHRCSDADDRHVWRFPEKLRREIGATTRLRDAPWPSTLSSDQVDLLRWAAGRPGVLSLLKALRAANYDETGTEYLRRIVSRDEAVPPPKPIKGSVVPLEAVVPEWAGMDDFAGEDFACFTGRCDRVERLENACEGSVMASALKVEQAWEGRTCAIELCSEKATGEVYIWALGNIPICDKHR